MSWDPRTLRTLLSPQNNQEMSAKKSSVLSQSGGCPAGYRSAEAVDEVQEGVNVLADAGKEIAF